jgi:hypothetical protein
MSRARYARRMLARASASLAAAVALAGCFVVVPRTDTHTYVESHEIVPHRAPAGPLAFTFRASATRLAIVGQYAATCRDDVHEVSVQRTHTHARFAAELDGGGQSLAVAIIIAPITIPITALYTVIVVAASNDAEVRADETHPGAPYPCAFPAAALALELATPDGIFAHGVTDAQGAVELPLDSGVPPGTFVRVTATGQTQPVKL